MNEPHKTRDVGLATCGNTEDARRACWLDRIQAAYEEGFRDAWAHLTPVSVPPARLARNFQRSVSASYARMEEE